MEPYKEYRTLNIVVSTGRSKELLGRNFTVKDLEELSWEEVQTYYKIYELNYSEKVSSSLNSALICLYSYAVNRILPIDDMEQLREDLSNSYILTNEMKNLTGGLALVGGKVWSLIELGLTTAKHIKVTTKELFKEQCGDNESTLSTGVSTLKELSEEQ